MIVNPNALVPRNSSKVPDHPRLPSRSRAFKHDRKVCASDCTQQILKMLFEPLGYFKSLIFICLQRSLLHKKAKYRHVAWFWFWNTLILKFNQRLFLPKPQYETVIDGPPFIHTRVLIDVVQCSRKVPQG